MQLCKIAGAESLHLGSHWHLIKQVPADLCKRDSVPCAMPFIERIAPMA